MEELGPEVTVLTGHDGAVIGNPDCRQLMIVKATAWLLA
jgi:hypothetical protein